MRSRADLRVVAEWLLRAALLGALGAALARSLAPGAEATIARRADARGLPAALAEATRAARVVSLAVHVDSLPAAAERAWLVALRRAGVGVSWSGQPASLAVMAERSREPDARVRISVVGDVGAPVAITDSAGAIDTVAVGARGGMLVAPAVVGAVRVARGRVGASAAVPAASPPRAVLVIGRAGWEAKFVAAALQEAGWTVRARQVIAPGVVVADPGMFPLDTSRYGVVVALDSTAGDLAADAARFVRQGGGLLLAGGASTLPAFAPLAPARAAERRTGRVLLDADTVTRGDLPVRALVAIRPDAVRLEGSSGSATVAVRRAGMGRVATIGFDETWRWRMLGGGSGPGAHRAWWSRTVGLVAPDAADVGVAAGVEAAPVASLIEALGQPSAAPAGDRAPAAPRLLPFLLFAIVAAMLAETASRRFRGAR